MATSFCVSVTDAGAGAEGVGGRPAGGERREAGRGRVLDPLDTTTPATNTSIYSNGTHLGSIKSHVELDFGSCLHPNQ